MITASMCRDGTHSWNEYYAQFITPRFREVAARAASIVNSRNRAWVLAGLPEHSDRGGEDASNNACTLALHDRWPSLVKGMRDTGKKNITLSDFLMLARACKQDG